MSGNQHSVHPIASNANNAIITTNGRIANNAIITTNGITAFQGYLADGGDEKIFNLPRVKSLVPDVAPNSLLVELKNKPGVMIDIMRILHDELSAKLDQKLTDKYTTASETCLSSGYVPVSHTVPVVVHLDSGIDVLMHYTVQTVPTGRVVPGRILEMDTLVPLQSRVHRTRDETTETSVETLQEQEQFSTADSFRESFATQSASRISRLLRQDDSMNFSVSASGSFLFASASTRLEVASHETNIRSRIESTMESSVVSAARDLEHAYERYRQRTRSRTQFSATSSEDARQNRCPTHAVDYVQRLMFEENEVSHRWEYISTYIPETVNVLTADANELANELEKIVGKENASDSPQRCVYIPIQGARVTAHAHVTPEQYPLNTDLGEKGPLEWERDLEGRPTDCVQTPSNAGTTET